MDHNEIVQLIQQTIGDADVTVSGEGCNLELKVVSEAFADQSMVARQQLVYQALAAAIRDGRIHAVSVDCYHPTEC